MPITVGTLTLKRRCGNDKKTRLRKAGLFENNEFRGSLLSFARFDRDGERSSDVSVELDLYVSLAGGLDWLVELDRGAVYFDAFVLESLLNIDGSDGTESLAIFANVQSELRLEASDLACKVLSDGELSGFTLYAARLEVFDLAEVALGCLVGFSRRDKEIAGKASFHFYNISFSAEVVDFFAEDNFCECHGLIKEKVLWRAGK